VLTIVNCVKPLSLASAIVTLAEYGEVTLVVVHKKSRMGTKQRRFQGVPRRCLGLLKRVYHQLVSLWDGALVVLHICYNNVIGNDVMNMNK